MLEPKARSSRGAGFGPFRFGKNSRAWLSTNSSLLSPKSPSEAQTFGLGQEAPGLTQILLF